MLGVRDMPELFTKLFEFQKLFKMGIYGEIGKLPRQHLHVPHKCTDIEVFIVTVELIFVVNGEPGILKARHFVL